MLTKTCLSQRRSNLEIVAEILRIARKGAKKTRIVYGANLNFKMLDEYLEKLGKAGLIANGEGNGGLIRTTDKGVEYLQQFHGLQEFGLA
jgi:predicted transcriptional regulator